jgi:hypothetical protein
MDDRPVPRRCTPVSALARSHFCSCTRQSFARRSLPSLHRSRHFPQTATATGRRTGLSWATPAACGLKAKRRNLLPPFPTPALRRPRPLERATLCAPTAGTHAICPLLQLLLHLRLHLHLHLHLHLQLHLYLHLLEHLHLLLAAVQVQSHLHLYFHLPPSLSFLIDEPSCPSSATASVAPHCALSVALQVARGCHRALA